MASNTLFPPIMDTTQPAFIYNEKCIVYFQLSNYNSLDDIKGLLFTLVNQKTNKTELDTATFTASQVFIEKNKFVKETSDLYSFSFSVGDTLLDDKIILYNKASNFRPDSYYKMQIRFITSSIADSIPKNPTLAWVNGNLDNFSEWSTVTIFTSIYIPLLHNLKISNIALKDEDLICNKVSDEISDITINETSINITGTMLFTSEAGSFVSRIDDENDMLDFCQFKISTLNQDDEVISEYLSDIFYTDIQQSGDINLRLKKPIVAKTKYLLSMTFTTHYGYTQDWFSVCYVQRNPVTLKEDLKYSVNNDESYIELSNLYNEVGTKYTILRSDSIDKFDEYSVLYEYNGTDSSNKFSFRDYTCQSGEFYNYRITDDKGKEYAMATDIAPVLVDCDDMFLYGGNGKQLKIKYNPQISSFKIKVSDSSYDTLGSKYPIIVRNGITEYKEFSISGLISMQSDENEIFAKDIDLANFIPGASYAQVGDGTLYDDPSTYTKSVYRHSTPSGITTETNVNAEFYKEKRFRDEVMKFLNNGKPKLLKSPSEGNIIVRLKDISFTPNQQLGRMIWSFSCNATEIDTCTLDKLHEYNLI